MKSRKQSDALERLLESARRASFPVTNLPPDFDRHLEAHRLAMADCSSSWMFSVCQCSLIVSLAVTFLCLALNPIEQKDVPLINEVALANSFVARGVLP